MAKHSSHILEMARKGAEHRYHELKEEIASLVKHFPHLTARKGGIVSHAVAAVPKGEKAATAEVAPRKRRKMSAKARKAISEAQKRRWAAQKANKK